MRSIGARLGSHLTPHSFFWKDCRLWFLAALLNLSCGFSVETDLCGQFESAPLKEAIGDAPAPVLVDPNAGFAVFHGSACARSDEDGRENIVKVEQSLELPPFVNQATVILNGWKVRYLHGDHHVEGVGTMIAKIDLQDGRLTWQAAGVLADDNFDDAYEWCYHYTVIAWNAFSVSALVDDDDADRFCKAASDTTDNFYFGKNKGTTTALASFSSFLQNEPLASRGSEAILPRGFGFRGDGDDHLLQLAYNLDHSEGIVEQGKLYWKGFREIALPSAESGNLVDPGFVSWDTYAVLKDNDKRKSYEFGEMVSLIRGSDVGIIQPSYTVLPREDDMDGCGTGTHEGVFTEEFTVENVPFECAVPALTGWDLAYGCDDEQVAEMGTWIDDWSYTVGAQGGTLRYRVSSILRDKDGSPGHIGAEKVAILGLRRLAITGGPAVGQSK